MTTVEVWDRTAEGVVDRLTRAGIPAENRGGVVYLTSPCTSVPQARMRLLIVDGGQITSFSTTTVWAKTPEGVTLHVPLESR